MRKVNGRLGPSFRTLGKRAGDESENWAVAGTPAKRSAAAGPSARIASQTPATNSSHLPAASNSPSPWSEADFRKTWGWPCLFVANRQYRFAESPKNPGQRASQLTANYHEV